MIVLLGWWAERSPKTFQPVHHFFSYLNTITIWLLSKISVASSHITARFVDLLISSLISCLQISKIDSKSSFSIVLDEPLKTAADSKCDLKLVSKLDVKSSNPRKTPGLSESLCSSCPLTATQNYRKILYN